MVLGVRRALSKDVWHRLGPPIVLAWSDLSFGELLEDIQKGFSKEGLLRKILVLTDSREGAWRPPESPPADLLGNSAARLPGEQGGHNQLSCAQSIKS